MPGPGRQAPSASPAISAMISGSSATARPTIFSAILAASAIAAAPRPRPGAPPRCAPPPASPPPPPRRRLAPSRTPRGGPLRAPRPPRRGARSASARARASSAAASARASSRTLGTTWPKLLTMRPMCLTPPTSAANASRRRPEAGGSRCATARTASLPSGASAPASARVPSSAGEIAGRFPTATRSTSRRAAPRASAGPGRGGGVEQRGREPSVQVRRGARDDGRRRTAQRDAQRLGAARFDRLLQRGERQPISGGAPRGPPGAPGVGQRHQPGEDPAAKLGQARRWEERSDVQRLVAAPAAQLLGDSPPADLRREPAAHGADDGRRLGRQPFAQPAGVDPLDPRRDGRPHQRDERRQRRGPRGAGSAPSDSSAAWPHPTGRARKARRESLGRHSGEQRPQDQPLLRQRKRRHLRMHGGIIG